MVSWYTSKTKNLKVHQFCAWYSWQRGWYEDIVLSHPCWYRNDCFLCVWGSVGPLCQSIFELARCHSFAHKSFFEAQLRDNEPLCDDQYSEAFLYRPTSFHQLEEPQFVLYHLDWAENIVWHVVAHFGPVWNSVSKIFILNRCLEFSTHLLSLLP